jgi:hypothetical protein
MEVVNVTSNEPVNRYTNFNNFIMNPLVLITITLIIVVYYAFSSSLDSGFGGPNQFSTGNSGDVFGAIIVSILVILILVNAMQYFFNINLITYFQELFPPTTSIDAVLDESTYKPHPAPEIRFNKKQVFNIPGNYYNYEGAKALCTAYGAKLATYDQVEKAYNNGAEWCNYGWSENQLALFPTQKQTYNNLQKIKGHENDCGRPGVNGGYIANPNVRFGVNCYGNKPKIRQDEDELMKTASPYPETVEDIEFQKRVDFMKNNLDQILVSPFNRNTWGEI